MKTNIQTYCLQALDWLDMPYQEIEPGIYEVHHLTTDPLVITFDPNQVSNATLITRESSVLKTIATLVATKKVPMMSGSVFFPIADQKEQLTQRFSPDHTFTYTEAGTTTNTWLIFWVKFTLKGFKDEEMIQLIRYNVEQEQFSMVPYSTDTLFSQIKDNNKRIRRSDMPVIYEQLNQFSMDVGKQFITEKNEEAKTLLEKEMKRIHEYYDLLELEDSYAETADLMETRNDRIVQLQKERLHLITQQRTKYAFTTDQLTIEPIESIHLIEEIETEKLVIQTKQAKKTILLQGDQFLPFIPEDLRDQNESLSILSDGSICLTKDVRCCEECHASFHYKNIKFCALCNKTVCLHCASRSHISHAVLCKEHTSTCTSCHKTASTNEMKTCDSCKSSYCAWCISGNLCMLCDDLY